MNKDHKKARACKSCGRKLERRQKLFCVTCSVKTTWGSKWDSDFKNKIRYMI